MVHANEFSYGPLIPALAVAMSCLGSFLGLRCATRARAYEGSARVRWLLLAAVSIGAAGIWVMHNIALLSFTIPGQTILYDVPISIGSVLIAVAVVFAALLVAGIGSQSFPPLLLGGIIIGFGVLASMDYVGMAAMRMPDTIEYNTWVVLLSALIAVTAAVFSLWAALRLRGLGSTVAASVIMGAGISGMHYTAMTAMRFVAAPAASMGGGATTGEFVLPLVLTVSVLTIILIASVALSPTAEEIRAEAILSERLARRQRSV